MARQSCRLREGGKSVAGFDRFSPFILIYSSDNLERQIIPYSRDGK